MEDAGVRLIAQGSAAYLSDMKAATNATNTFVDSTEKGSHRVSAAGQVIIGGLRQMGTMAVDAFAKAAKAGLDFAKDSIDLAADFEQTMNVLQATSEATAEEMAAVSRKAKELGSDLSLPATSAVDAGEAMLELSKAGFSVQESMDAAKGTLQLAAAAQIEEAKAAEISSNAINAFGLAAKDALFVSDLLAASANASSVEITDVAQSYQMAGAIFANFQGPVVGSKEAIVDLTTAVGILGNAGIKGSDAGTSLKQALLQLTGPSDKAKGLMKALAEDIGVAGDIAYDAQGKMRSFPEILDITARATKSLTDEKRNQYITDIFGADASRAVLVLMKQGPAAWAEMEAAVTRQGAAAELAAAKTQGYKGAIEGAKSQVETLQLTLAAGLLPVLADLFNNYISPGIASVTEFAESFLKMVPAIAASDDPLQTFLNALKIAAPGLFDFIVAIEDIKDAITPAVQEVMRLADAFSKNGLGGLIETLTGDIQAALPDIEAALLEWGQAFVAWIEPMIPPALDALAALADSAWGWVQDQAPKWGAQLQVWGGELIAWIAPMIPPALVELGKLGDQFLGWIGEQATPLLKRFNDWATSFVAWIPGATVMFLAEWPGMLDEFLDWIGESAGPLLKQLGDWALSFIGWIAPMIPPFLLALGGVALALGAFVIETAAVLSKRIVEKWIPAILGWIVTDAIPGLYVALNDFLQVFQDWIEDAQADLAIWMREVGSSIVEGIKKGISDAWSSLSNWLSDKIAGLFDVGMEAQDADSPSKLWMPVGQSIVQGIMLGLSEQWGGLTALIGSLSKDLVDEMQDIGSQIQGVIADSFGATASIDRQIAKNLDKFKDILPQYQQYTQGALKEAEQQARAFADPAEGARFFKMRSDQILEYAKLQKDLADAETASDRERIEAQMLLINAAQSAELAQFNATPRSDPKTDIARQINEIIAALADPKLKLTDEQLHYVDMLSAMLDRLGGVPHLAAGGVAHAGQPHWVGEDGPELFWPGVTGMVSPAASSQQMAARGPVYNGQVGNTYNNTMPIYTNNSPAALQQSWAIVQASMA